jgi:hypothetical protein
MVGGARPAAERQLIMWHIRAVVVIAVLIAVLAGCDNEASVRASVSAAQKHFQPVLDALAKYNQEHSKYPAKLDDLIAEGLLAEVPHTPVVGNAYAEDLSYEVAKDGRSCQLHFYYHLKNQGIGPGDTTYVDWRSDTGEWSMRGPGY